MSIIERNTITRYTTFYPGKTSWGRKPSKNFINIDRPKIKQNILFYSFTRKSSAPLNQEIPRDRPKTSLTSPLVALGSPQDLHIAKLVGVCPNEALASLINSGLVSL
jgi:hypothetical protein